MTSASIVITWDDTGTMPATGHWELYYDTTNHGTDYAAVVANATRLPAGRVYGFTIPGLSFGETYYSWVRFKSSSGYGDWYGPKTHVVEDGIDAASIQGIDDIVTDVAALEADLATLTTTVGTKVPKTDLTDLTVTGTAAVQALQTAINAIHAVLRG